MQPHDTLPYTLPDLPDDERVARGTALRERLASRRSCRYFSDAPIPREVIEQAILAAGSAPNGANHQPWHFAVVSSPETKRAIRAAAEEEERAFYAGKASGEWLEALGPLKVAILIERPAEGVGDVGVVLRQEHRAGQDLVAFLDPVGAGHQEIAK